LPNTEKLALYPKGTSFGANVSPIPKTEYGLRRWCFAQQLSQKHFCKQKKVGVEASVTGATAIMMGGTP
jgi:hypothetical protein